MRYHPHTTDVRVPSEGSHDAVFFFKLQSGLVVLKKCSAGECLRNSIADEICQLVSIPYPATRALNIPEEAEELSKAISLALDSEQIRDKDVQKKLKSIEKDLRKLSKRRKSLQSENEQVFLVSEFISAAPFSDFEHLYCHEETVQGKVS